MASALVGAERAELNGGVLPADVMHEILLRVPAKALCRLRLVCRSWRSFTSDLRFATEHLPRHPLFVACDPFWAQIHVVDMSGEIVKQICSFESFGYYKLSVQADLICISETKQARLLNPATGEIDALPDGTLYIGESRCILARIPSTGEYKVLRIRHSPFNLPRHECEVITLGSDDDQEWRVRSEPPLRVYPTFYRVAAIDGVAYFLAAPLTCSDGIKRDSVVVFDFATEEWRPTVLQVPLSTDDPDDTNMLVKLSGCLVMVYHNNQHCSLDLWFLVDADRGLWNKRYSMTMQNCRWKPEAPYPLAVLDDGKVVLWLQTPRVLKTYDPRTGIWVDLATLGDYFFVGMLEGSLLCSGLQN